ncbi:hypothetical protein PsorP6_011101 [Peronosclerospora sorghi]|uniref:Uncharacterized protein n=1 Tax=Peronosclerospora sorghi TaxID=230839 RepID=A0ACC0VWU2_9STRA|nr:hypothetical protein PsorP6_011101 [Peronosclerospora sorghi]
MFCENGDKTALAFILNPLSRQTNTSMSLTLSPLVKPDVNILGFNGNVEDNAANVSKQTSLISGTAMMMDHHVRQVLDTTNGKTRVRKIFTCVHDDCHRVAVSRGRCVRHGGGSRCRYPNCMHGARLYNLCFHHGGSKLCKIVGCTSKAKRYGHCWSHGGGHICDAPNCSKVAAPGGYCWAHGGGNRCKIDGCNRRSYQKHDYFCKQHAMQCTKAS